MTVIPSIIYAELCLKFKNLGQIEIAIREFERFFMLAIKLGEQSSNSTLLSTLPVHTDIDEIWHYCILQTSFYKEMCNAVVPGSFLHHRSVVSDSQCPIRPESWLENLGMLSYLVSYRVNFGDFTHDSVKYWIVCQAILNEMGWSISELNAFLDHLSKSQVGSENIE